MASEDDDVIFEGQELQKYLEKIGFQDFEVIKSPTSSKNVISEARDKTALFKCLFLFRSFLDTVWNWFRQPWIPTIRSVDTVALHKQVQTIVESYLLFEDDVHFINNISGTDTEKFETSFASHSHHISADSTCLFPWCCYSLWNMTVLPVTGSVILCVALSWKRMNEKRKQFLQLKALLQVMKDLYIVFWKSLKLLQENELILRGFTLARTGSTVSRLEDSDLPCMIRKWDSSPGLRIAVAQILLSVISTLRTSTQQLVFHCPLFGQLDNPSHYLSYLDDKALGLISLDTNARIKLNDLKRLHHVFLLLQSEFLRRLALSFCPNLWKHNSLKQIANVMQTICDVRGKYTNLNTSLSREYNVFYAFGVSETSEPNSLRINKDLMKTTDAEVAVRSASLHLQAVLFSTRTLELKLEARKESGEENLEEVLSHLSDVVRELDVCKSCCEEGAMQIQKLLVPAKQLEIKDMAEVKPQCQVREKDIDVKIIPVGYTDLDPHVDDEIFEAVITKDSTEPDSDHYDEELAKEEKKQYEIAKQLSKKMMQELKSVLVIKAEKWKEREAKAMQMKLGKSEVISGGPKEELGEWREQFHEQTHEPKGRSQDEDPPDSTDSSFTMDIGTSSKVASYHSTPKHSSLLQESNSEGECIERNTNSPVSNTSSSSSNIQSRRSPKQIYATETFRPLQHDLQFSVGLHLSSEALAKFQARNVGSSDTFSGMGEKSSSEESLNSMQ